MPLPQIFYGIAAKGFSLAFMAGELPPSRNRRPASSGIWNSVRNDCRR